MRRVNSTLQEEQKQAAGTQPGHFRGNFCESSPEIELPEFQLAKEQLRHLEEEMQLLGEQFQETGHSNPSKVFWTGGSMDGGYDKTDEEEDISEDLVELTNAGGNLDLMESLTKKRRVLEVAQTNHLSLRAI